MDFVLYCAKKKHQVKKIATIHPHKLGATQNWQNVVLMPWLVNSSKVKAQCICYCCKRTYVSLEYLPLVANLWRTPWYRKCYYCGQWPILCLQLHHIPGILIKIDTMAMNNMLREAFIHLLHEGVSRSLFSVVDWTVIDVNDQNMK